MSQYRHLKTIILKQKNKPFLQNIVFYFYHLISQSSSNIALPLGTNILFKDIPPVNAQSSKDITESGKTILFKNTPLPIDVSESGKTILCKDEQQ